MLFRKSCRIQNDIDMPYTVTKIQNVQMKQFPSHFEHYNGHVSRITVKSVHVLCVPLIVKLIY